LTVKLPNVEKNDLRLKTTREALLLYYPDYAAVIPDRIRLSKLMSQRGLCSRREADQYIERGLVKVDGQTISVLGTRVDPEQTITLDQRATKLQQQRKTVLLNKPLGYVSSQPEDDHEPAIKLLIPGNHFPNPEHKHQAFTGLAPAGRLDIDSSGLLVLTQDGRIAKQLIGNDKKVDKEYLVRVSGLISPAALSRLCHGITLDGRPLLPAKIRALQRGLLQFVLREGRKRQIRRMCQEVDLQVTQLKRVRIGKVVLGNLPEGRWRLLRKDETF